MGEAKNAAARAPVWRMILDIRVMVIFEQLFCRVRREGFDSSSRERIFLGDLLESEAH